MKRFFAYLLFLIPLFSSAQAVRTPDAVFGDLFVQVQMQRVFPDNKTFADAVPVGHPDSIVALYHDYRQQQGFLLDSFVRHHFTLLQPVAPTWHRDSNENIKTHITQLWDVLQRTPDSTVNGSSLLPLPHSYIVPGGRFREVYYWDSYFTMLGLEISGKYDLMENILDNFAYLIDTYGHIPNGNRSYFLSRSQPPYFALMIQLLAEKKGNAILQKYLPSLQKEYDYWMDETAGTQHKVVLKDGSILNRYWDQNDRPREESFYEDSSLAIGRTDAAQLYRDLRSAAESGWDFGTRWFADGHDIRTIQTTNILPVDLNCLLYFMEKTLSKAYLFSHKDKLYQKYSTAAQKRKAAIEKYFYNARYGWYYDYVISEGKPSEQNTIAGITPLFFGITPKNKTAAIFVHLRKYFVRPGGVATTVTASGQQWDAPNGWAPLQWITIHALENYQQHRLATTIAKRWISLNTEVFRTTGKLMEKYNVVDTHLPAGGGEYPSQDGFGWTNGVLLKLLSIYGQ